jgi:hypothetical protein
MSGREDVGCNGDRGEYKLALGSLTMRCGLAPPSRHLVFITISEATKYFATSVVGREPLV